MQRIGRVWCGLAAAVVPWALAFGSAGGPPVHLAAGVIHTTETGNPLKRLADAAGSPTRFVVQLSGPMTHARRSRLRHAGVTVGDYLPTDAYVMSLRNADPARLAGLSFVRWCAPFRPEWKLDPSIGTLAATTDERAALERQGRRALIVTLFGDAPRNAANRAIWAIPGAMVHWSETIAGHETLGVELNAPDVTRLREIDAVQFVEEAPQITLRNGSARWVATSNTPGFVPPHSHGLRGEDEVIGILDGRIDRNHCAFADTQPIGPAHRKILAYNATFGADAHGTHVACSALGDAGADNDTRGLAYAAKLVFGVIPERTESSIFAALQRHATQGAAVHVNSWGNDATTAYDSLSRGFDAFLHDNEGALAVVAVSNLATIRNPENAKNVLAVAASGDAPHQHLHCSGGAGPTIDGRRKPEVLAPGCGIMSAESRTACGVKPDAGTSMAAPLVAGAGSLVRQYFARGFYPGGEANPTAGFSPSGALLRAVLVNASVDMTGISGYPSETEGWGRLLLDGALYFRGDRRRLMVDEVQNAGGLATAGLASIPLRVSTPSEPLRITLAWTDPPASPGAGQAAVNNLDLEVQDPGGVVYRGNAFSGGFSAPGGAADSVNNVEQVHVASPVAGDWTIRVRGTRVAVGRQGYALAITGDVSTPAPRLSLEPVEALSSLVRPGQPTAIDVWLRERGESLVPGSPALHYRMGSGPWVRDPLVQIDGDRWRGVLPAAACGQRAEFYLAAEGSVSGVRLSPPDAVLNPYAADVGSLERELLLEEGFEHGMPASWLTTGLWRATSQCAPAPPCEGAAFAYFGSVATCTYATGFRVSGVLAAPPVALPHLHPAGSVRLTYCYNLQTEAVQGFDKGDVLVNGVVIDEPVESDQWSTRSVDLSAFAGQTIRITFRFDSMDGYINGFRGFQVDDVRVEVTQPECGSACYPDCDTSTGTGVLDIFDFLCFQNSFAGAEPYACDCDVSRGPGVCDIFDFLCFLNAYDAGCP